MPVTQASLALQAQLDAELEQVTDEHVRLLVEAWVVAWAEVATDLQDTLTSILAAAKGTGRVTASTLRRSLRLRRVLNSIAGQLDRLATEANVTLTTDLAGITERAAKTQTQILAAQLPDEPAAADLLDASWTSDDDDALAAIVRRTTERIASSTNRLTEEAADAVRRELIRGVAVGSNPRATARRMVARVEGRFNGGLNRAMNIARTETLDAHRAAAQHGQDRHTDVLTGWVWLCHLGPRTCPACLVRHGTLHSLDEAGPHDHPQGRCSRMPKTKTWADLGFEGLDEPEDDITDARAWFHALTENEQAAILGRERLRMLRAGEITWEQLATLRRNPGWRDSWQVTPLKQLQSSRGRAAS